MNSTLIHVSILELCRQINEPRETIIEFVEYGIIDAQGEAPDKWSFEESAIIVARRALRLRRDLEINWAGIALALELLEQKESVISENIQLKQRLSRFLADDD